MTFNNHFPLQVFSFLLRQMSGQLIFKALPSADVTSWLSPETSFTPSLFSLPPPGARSVDKHTGDAPTDAGVGLAQIHLDLRLSLQLDLPPPSSFHSQGGWGESADSLGGAGSTAGHRWSVTSTLLPLPKDREHPRQVLLHQHHHPTTHQEGH